MLIHTNTDTHTHVQLMFSCCLSFEFLYGTLYKMFRLSVSPYYDILSHNIFSEEVPPPKP